MHRLGLTPVVRFCESLESLPAVEDLLNHTAIVCVSDGLAYTLHAKLTAAGVQLPEECSLVGFDNLPTDNPYPLTTYAPNWELMGRMAANLLLSQPLNIHGQDLVITVAGQLIVRKSSAPRSGIVAEAGRSTA